MSVYPAEESWLVQITLPTGEWGVAQPPSDRKRAYERLKHNRRARPDRQHRIVKVTTVYTQEFPEPFDGIEDIGIEEVLAFIAAEAERQRSYVESVRILRDAELLESLEQFARGEKVPLKPWDETEHTSENFPADNEDDSK